MRVAGLRVLRWLSGAALVCGCCACDVYRAELLQFSEQRRLDAAAPAQALADAQPEATMTVPTQPTPPAHDTAQSRACARGSCWWSTSVDGCESASLPGVNARPNASGVSLPEIYLGLTSVQLTDVAGQAAWGFDLDGVCTNAPNCKGRRSALPCKSLTTQLPFDGEDCRDNTFARLMSMLRRIPQIADGLGLRDETINCELWRGSYNILLRITDYDGSSDDASVRVDWYTSNGLASEPSWRCPAPDFTAKHPRWASDASWNVDASQLTAAVMEPSRLPASRISDPDAYVRGGYLVSRFAQAALLRFAGDAKPLRGFATPVHHGLWVGRLTRAPGAGWTMDDGLIAGRVRSDDLLRSLRQSGVCRSGPAAQFVDGIESYVAENTDLLASGSNAPDQACDAMSFGIAFSAAEVTPGPATQLEPLVECCDVGEACEARCGDGKVTGAERCDSAIETGQPGACPAECVARSSCERRRLEGSACEAHCVETPIRDAVPGDGCCPDGATSLEDADCSPRCGNGVIERGEVCDPPETCPSCVTLDKCLRIHAGGSAQTCDVVCHVTAVEECRSEDGCCAEGCTRGADNDCSSSCGNGMVDPGTSETCERTACIQNCDDQDPCTLDVRTGSAANCNVRCSHFRIYERLPNDHCCPPGADATTDPDC